jgi:hypothetical protein
MNITINAGASNDWSEVVVDGEVVYRGHQDEAKEKALELLGVEFDYETEVTGKRVNLLDDLDLDLVTIPRPDKTWINALTLLSPSGKFLTDVGGVVVHALKESSHRVRTPDEPVMDVTLRFVAT